MTIHLDFGWWLIPFALSCIAIVWTSRFDYNGDYNFTAAFTYPVAIAGICFVWMIYFALT